MFCKMCGTEIKDGEKVCSVCGFEAGGVEAVKEAPIVAGATAGTAAEKPADEPRVWSVFAKVGFGLGLGSLIGFWIIGLSMTLSVAGLVFSILGKKSSAMKDKAQKGMILSIIAMILSFIAIIVLSVIIALVGGEEYSDSFYY